MAERATAANCPHEWSPWWEGVAVDVGEWRVCRLCTKREIRNLSHVRAKALADEVGGWET